MPNAATAGKAGSAAPSAGGVIPFFYGTNQYAEKMFTSTDTLTANQVEHQYNITPGGFLRGVRLIVRSAAGVIGGGTLIGDSPWAVIASATVENIDGAPILYPMSGYAHYVRGRFSRPWDGDAALRPGFSNTVNPAFDLFLRTEIRQTAGVLANTDARAQYRVRYTVNTIAGLFSVAPGTPPAVTVTGFLETWAQPDSRDLNGTPIEELPPGLNLAVLARHQVNPMLADGASNLIQLANTGNEIRCFIHIVRTAAGVRINGYGDPIRWRLDNRSLGVFSPDELMARTADFYEPVQNGTSAIPTGVYVFPRFYDPGRMVGEAWFATTNATYAIWETVTAAGAGGGTTEVITDEVVTVGPVPMALESI